MIRGKRDTDNREFDNMAKMANLGQPEHHENICTDERGLAVFPDAGACPGQTFAFFASKDSATICVIVPRPIGWSRKSKPAKKLRGMANGHDGAKLHGRASGAGDC
jgi:hypothetical protein